MPSDKRICLDLSCGDCKHINLTDIQDEDDRGRSYACSKHPHRPGHGQLAVGVTTRACEQFERAEQPLHERW